MPINFDLKQFNTNSIFLETGTYIGEGVNKALESGFKNIISIELDSKRFESCTEKFKENKNVIIKRGDSGKILRDVITNINEPITFFLDAHYCADDAEISDKWCPLKEELTAIKNHHIKTHTILIDDWRCMDNTHIDEKTQIPVGFLGKENCLKMIKSINPNYNITFLKGCIEGDVLCAKIIS